MPLFWFGLIKRILFPVRGLESLCPKKGVIVDLGCGNGFFSWYLATRGVRRVVLGFDWDAHRLEKLKSSFLPNNLLFAVADIAEAVGEVKQVDHFLISDVLYLLPRPKQDEVLKACYQRLPQKGSLIVKIADTAPKWKCQWECFQETLAVRWLRISKSGEKKFTGRSAAGYQTFLSSLGFSVTLHRLDKFRPYPHVALVCVK